MFTTFFACSTTGVKLVMEAVCVMKNIKPKKIQDPAGGLKKVDDYWGPAQSLLAEANFLESLQVGEGACVCSWRTRPTD